MITVNHAWLKLAENVTPATVKWVAFIVLNKLQKSGRAKITQVTF